MKLEEDYSFSNTNLFDAVAQSIKKEYKEIVLLKNEYNEGDKNIVEAVIPMEKILEQAEEIASTLYEAGLRAGDKVVLIPAMTPSAISVFLALARLDCITVFAPIRLLAYEIAEIISITKARFCVCSDEYEHLNALKQQRTGICNIYTIAATDVSEICFGQKTCDMPIMASYSGNEEVAIMFTSGTSGQSKGVILPHRAYIKNAEQISRHIGLTAKDTFLQTLPLYYIAGQVTALMSSLLFGKRLVLCRKFNPELVVQAILQLDVTVTNMVPTLIKRLVGYLEENYVGRGKASDINLLNNKLRLCLTGGAVCNEALKSKMKSFFETQVIEGYGSTEGGCGICINPLDKPKSGSVGIPLAGQVIRIVLPDNRNTCLAPYDIGEIQVKNDTTMLGYYENPESTKAAFDGEWLRIGDLGYVDEEGYVFICGRESDLIKRGGEKIYVGEIENVISNCPLVDEVAVVARPDEELGECPVAFFTTKDQSTRVNDVMEWINERLPYYRRPELVYIESMPMTNSGKIAKHTLRTRVKRSSET